MAPPIEQAATRGHGAEQQVLGDAHVRRELQLLMDDGDARRSGGARPVKTCAAGLEMQITPVSGRCSPERILSNVDLPAPFSPISARISPSSNLKGNIVERDDAGKALADAAELEPRRAHASCSAFSSCQFSRVITLPSV